METLITSCIDLCLVGLVIGLVLPLPRRMNDPAPAAVPESSSPPVLASPQEEAKLETKPHPPVPKGRDERATSLARGLLLFLVIAALASAGGRDRS